MITVAHRRRPSPALLAMLVVLGLPALAQAQMFPNLFVRRERPSCAAEDPIYRVYRQQFYGYYPTQWRAFPPGWHIASPEGVTPDQLTAARTEIQKEVERQKAQGPQNGEEPGPDDTEMPETEENPQPPTLPVPRGGSVFDLNPQPPADPGPLPDDTEAPPAPRTSTKPPAGGPAAAPADPLDLAPPLEDAGSTPASVERDSPPPLPAIDGAVSPGTTYYAPRDDDMPVPPLGAARNANVSTNTAPARKTLLGGLFDTMRGRRRR